MKRLLFISVLFASLFTSCKKQWTGEHITLNLADVHPQGFPTVIGCQDFANSVYERSHGRIIINVQTEAFSETTLVESVRAGKLDFARVSGGLLADVDADFRVLNIPFLFRDAGHFWKVLNSEIGQHILDGLWSYGFAGLCYYESGARSFYANTPVYTLDDLRHLKIRIQNNSLMLNFITALGATPYPIEYNDVFPAFTNNAIQAAENNIPSYWSARHYQVARYYFADQHTRIPDLIIASKKMLATLSAEDIALIKKAAADSVHAQRLAWEEYELNATRSLTKEGIYIITPHFLKDSAATRQISEALAKSLPYPQQQLFEEIRHTK
mgnify:FL=1